MNVCKRFGGVAFALALLCGYGAHTHSPSVLLARADPPAPAAQKARRLPAWAEKFNSAVGMIGKPKKELYDAFGIPATTNTQTGTYGYRGDSWNLNVDFDKEGKVSACTLTFDKFKPERPSVANSGGYYKTELLIGVADVWEAVAAPGSKPENCYIDRIFTQDSAPYGGEQKQIWDVSPSGLSGKSKSGPEIFLALGKPIGNPSANAFLTCRRKFNPDTNRFDSATSTVKSSFNWKPRQVRIVTTNPSALGNEDYTASKYIKYPVP